jgi:dimethylargininase
VILIGNLERCSNQAAIDQMQAFLSPYGYTVQWVQVTGCLHLKSALTQVKADMLLVNPAWVDKINFPGMKFIEIDPSEQYAANVLMVGANRALPTCLSQDASTPGSGGHCPAIGGRV